MEKSMDFLAGGSWISCLITLPLTSQGTCASRRSMKNSGISFTRADIGILK